jgi:hypothetical protein
LASETAEREGEDLVKMYIVTMYQSDGVYSGKKMIQELFAMGCITSLMSRDINADLLVLFL